MELSIGSTANTRHALFGSSFRKCQNESRQLILRSSEFALIVFLSPCLQNCERVSQSLDVGRLATRSTVGLLTNDDEGCTTRAVVVNSMPPFNGGMNFTFPKLPSVAELEDAIRKRSGELSELKELLRVARLRDLRRAAGLRPRSRKKGKTQ